MESNSVTSIHDPPNSKGSIPDKQESEPPVISQTPAAPVNVPMTREVSEEHEGSASEESGEEDGNDHDNKRQKISITTPGHEHEKVFATTTQRREQNRVHARNTRERKKLQLDLSHKMINQLYEERARLCAILTERTGELPHQFVPTMTGTTDKESTDCMKDIDNAMKKVEEAQDNSKDNTSAELMWNIRKEKNRIHARKTRLRKKLALDEAENTLHQLKVEIAALQKRVAAVTGNAAELIAQHGMSFHPPPGVLPNNFSNGSPQRGMSTSFAFPPAMNQVVCTQLPMSMSMVGGPGMTWGNMQLQRDGGFNVNVSGFMPSQYQGMVPFNQCLGGMFFTDNPPFPNMRGYMSGGPKNAGVHNQMFDKTPNPMDSAPRNPGFAPKPK